MSTPGRWFWRRLNPARGVLQVLSFMGRMFLLIREPVGHGWLTHCVRFDLVAVHLAASGVVLRVGPRPPSIRGSKPVTSSIEPDTHSEHAPSTKSVRFSTRWATGFNRRKRYHPGSGLFSRFYLPWLLRGDETSLTAGRADLRRPSRAAAASTTATGRSAGAAPGTIPIRRWRCCHRQSVSNHRLCCCPVDSVATTRPTDHQRPHPPVTRFVILVTFHDRGMAPEPTADRQLPTVGQLPPTEQFHRQPNPGQHHRAARLGGRRFDQRPDLPPPVALAPLQTLHPRGFQIR